MINDTYLLHTTTDGQEYAVMKADTGRQNYSLWNKHFVCQNTPDGWQSLGSGMNDYVRALAIFNGELIAGGDFTNAGGVKANNIAKWNGKEWAPLGKGMDGCVRALASYKGELYAGGLFSIAGEIPAEYIAKWDGEKWSPLDEGPNWNVRAFVVYALTVNNGKLIATGSFMAKDGAGANNTATWDGMKWTLGE